MGTYIVFFFSLYYLTINPPHIFLDGFIGVNSASKDHNKKGSGEDKEMYDLGILSFSPERR